MARKSDSIDGKGPARFLGKSEGVGFHVHARRDKILGKWAAKKIGIKGPEAERYVTELVFANLEEAWDDYIIRKLQLDFAYHGLPIKRDEIIKKMQQAHKEALAEFDD